MAILFRGMEDDETRDLTLAMARSGDVLDLSDIADVVVDKHSTGGIGDKVSLVVAPVVAAAGLPVGKMSGRGLGFSGGTIDKLESIPGYRVNLTVEQFRRQLSKIGIVLTGQSANLAPADGKLYALRDVTGTVPSLPLIVSSIMSKKIAAGAQRIVLDVKLGHGAFMKDLEDARLLAKTMVWIGKETGREAVALLSDMNQPLGCAVGNANEVLEAIETLKGGGPQDLRQHSLDLAAFMLVLGEVASDEQSAARMVEQAVTSGRAFERFRQLVQAQGGDVSYVDHPEKLTLASIHETLRAPRTGYLKEMNALLIGEASVLLGAGRMKKGDPIDHAVGIYVHHKVGDQVEAGEPLLTMYANRSIALADARRHLAHAIDISEASADPLPLFYDIIRWKDIERPSEA
jgi:pyrimidine-nucleoside phosphorylase